MPKQPFRRFGRRGASAIVIGVSVALSLLTGGATAAPSPIPTTTPGPGDSVDALLRRIRHATPTPTPTAVPPTATRTATPRPPTTTSTVTATPRPPTATSTVTATPRPPTATSTVTATPLPATATSTAVVPTPTAVATGGPHISNCPTLPADNIWNARVDSLPVHALSAAYMASIGNTVGLHPDFGTVWNGAPNGIPYVIVPGTQSRVPVSFTYADESDPGPYPIPPDAPIEGGANSGGDRHVLIVDGDHCVLYELYAAYPQPDGSWTAGSGAVFPLTSDALRPSGWTSADAAGLPILPGLVRYDEVRAGAITHALRFTAAVTQHAFVWPARHFASSNTSSSVPPMGTRLRLKSGVDITRFSPANQVILQALKTYGMILADNGSNLFISGAPDSRWNDSDLANLRQVVGSNLEVIDATSLQVDPNSGQAR